MKRIMHTIDVLEKLVVAVLAGLALTLACLSMAGRYLLPDLRLDWTFEVTIFLSTWAVLLCAARLVGVDGHVRVDSLFNLLPPPLRTALSFFALLCAIGAAGFLVFSGTIVVEEAILWNEKTTSSLRIPLWYLYLSLPVSMVLLVLHAVVRFVEHVTGERYHPGPIAEH